MDIIQYTLTHCIVSLCEISTKYLLKLQRYPPHKNIKEWETIKTQSKVPLWVLSNKHSLTVLHKFKKF